MPIPLRTDFDASALRSYAKKTRTDRSAAASGAGGDLRRRHPHGGSEDRRCDAADRSDWVVKFNAHGPDGLIDRKSPGQPSRLNDTHRAAIARWSRADRSGNPRRGALARD